MTQAPTLEELRVMAEHAGLRLGDDELLRLVPGVNRLRAQVADLRELITDPEEPAGTF